MAQCVMFKLFETVCTKKRTIKNVLNTELTSRFINYINKIVLTYVYMHHEIHIHIMHPTRFPVTRRRI